MTHTHTLTVLTALTDDKTQHSTAAVINRNRPPSEQSLIYLFSWLCILNQSNQVARVLDPDRRLFQGRHFSTCYTPDLGRNTKVCLCLWLRVRTAPTPESIFDQEICLTSDVEIVLWIIVVGRAMPAASLCCVYCLYCSLYLQRHRLPVAVNIPYAPFPPCLFQVFRDWIMTR